MIYRRNVVLLTHHSYHNQLSRVRVASYVYDVVLLLFLMFFFLVLPLDTPPLYNLSRYAQGDSFIDLLYFIVIYENIQHKLNKFMFMGVKLTPYHRLTTVVILLNEDQFVPFLS